MPDQEQFDISIDRVDKLPVPLLVVGLGGTGRDAVITIKKTFAERYNLPKTSKGEDKPAPVRTAYLVFDSEAQVPDDLAVNEYVDISFPGIEGVLTNQKDLLTAYERTWINPKLKAASSSIGAGTIRQAARLMLSRNYSKVETALKGALDTIVSQKAGLIDPNVKQVEIVIVTGIGGGTGSGIFLDMAQIIRHVEKQVTVLPCKITGYIVMPDVSLENVKTATGMEGPIKHNAYAALKELDFWMRVKEHGTPYTMKYGATEEAVNWKEKPFDYCILMSKSNVNGIPYLDGYDAVKHTIAENLLHYMAKEDAVNNTYSYKRYEDNLGAIPAIKTYPLNYAYRVIGAFTKRIPKKPILYYEGKLLLETFMPKRNAKDLLVPNDVLLTDGKNEQRAAGIAGDYRALATAFLTNHGHLPNECALDVRDHGKVESVQNQSPEPHNPNRWQKWRDQVCTPEVRTAADTYVSETWGRFAQFADKVITNPELGPFALKLYLEDANGLMKELNETLASWQGVERKLFATTLKTKQQDCDNFWQQFVHPPLLGKTGAQQSYVDSLKSLYTTVCNGEFIKYHVKALEKVIKRIGEYLEDGLKPLCAGLEVLEGAFMTAETNDRTLVDDIYQLTDVQARIDDTFTDVNAQNKMTIRFLNDLATVSKAHTDTVEEGTSGWKFSCRRGGLDEMCDVIQTLLQEQYATVNDQSLDDVMRANAGDIVQDQQSWMNDLVENTVNSALPMFLMDGTFAAEHKVAYSYMSIPQDAKEHLNYINTAFKTHQPPVEPKASTLTDHIYSLMAWDKMPLYRYGMMEDLRRQYYADLNKPDYAGMHLVRAGAAEPNYTNDWSLLPSPKPCFLFPVAGNPTEQQEYQKIKELTERAIKCGMVKVDSSQPECKISVRVKYANAENAQPVNGNVLTDYLDEVRKSKNPITGDQLSPQEAAEKIREYLDGFDCLEYTEAEVSATTLDALCGLTGQPINPWDDNIKADPILHKKAEENYKTLCNAMASVYLYRNPKSASAVEIQLDSYEELDKFVKKAGRLQEIWKNRNQYASTAAKIFIHLDEKIFMGANGYKYKAKEGKYDIVTANLLSEDLQEFRDYNLVQTVAFLADVSEDNPARNDLERMMNNAVKDYTEGLDDGSIKAADVQILLDAADGLKKDLEDEINALVREGRDNPSKAQTLNYAADFLKEVLSNVSSEERQMRKVMKGLD